MAEYLVNDGETSTGIELTYGDLMQVSSGGTAINTAANEDGILNIFSGGSAIETTVNEDGILNIFSGGKAIDTTVNEKGNLFIYSGGTATEITAETGAGFSWEMIPETYVLGTYDGRAFEIKDGIASGCPVCSAQCVVYSGGTATNTAVYDGGNFIVSDGGKAIETTMIEDCNFDVDNGGSANKTTVWTGKFTVYGGGKATEIEVSGGGLIVYGGGKATGITAQNGVFLSFTLAPGTYVQGTYDGSSFEIKDGKADGCTVYKYCTLTVADGGKATDTVVNWAGNLHVSSGGTATATAVCAGGVFHVSSGGTATDTTVNDAGYLYVFSGGSVRNVAVNNGGNLWVYSGGKATGITAEAGGHMSLTLAPGTDAQGTYDGSAFEIKDGKVSGYTTYEGGALNISSGGTATDTTVNGGNLWVSSGGTACGVAVNNGGKLIVSGGGKLTGKMTFGNTAEYYIYDGAIIDFDLAKTSPENAALVNDLSVINGTPKYTLTVSGGEADGTYRLADGASGFNKTITVRNTSGAELGTLTVGGGAQEFGEVQYALALDGSGSLTATICNVAPSNGPDNNTNDDDKMWNNKTKTPGEAYTTGTAAVLAKGDTDVLLDVPKSVRITYYDETFYDDEEDKSVTYRNFVGMKKENEEDAEYREDFSDSGKVKMNTGARLSFTVTAKASGKFVIYQIIEKWDRTHTNCTYKRKILQTTKVVVKKNATNARVTTKALYLNANTQYVLSMQYTKSKKNPLEDFYNVELNYIDDDVKKKGTHFYVDDDNGDNNWLYDRKKNKLDPWNHLVTDDASPVKFSETEFTDKAVQLDKTKLNFGEKHYTNFVGYGDEMDVKTIHLDHGAKLSFSIDAEKGAKLVLYRKNDRGGCATVVSTSTKGGSGKPTKFAILDKPGDYYLAVKSTGAKKGDEAHYNVTVSGVIYVDGDLNTNNYDSKKKKVGDEVRNASALTLTPAADGGLLRLDGVLAGDKKIDHGVYRNFVGTGDISDVAKINATAGSSVTFKVTATDAVNFAVYGLQENGKLKELKSLKLKNSTEEGNTLAYTFKEKDGITFFIGVTATNAKKGSAAHYNVQVLPEASPGSRADGLAMPETSDALGISDPLSFGQYGADVLADASASSLAELDDKSAWLNITTLA